LGEGYRVLAIEVGAPLRPSAARAALDLKGAPNVTTNPGNHNALFAQKKDPAKKPGQ